MEETMKIAIILALILPIAPLASAADSWSVGELRQSGIGSYKKLLAEFDGWRIWETSGKGSITCVAVKPAESNSWPRISDGYGIVTGGTGFYMHIGKLLKRPYFGFYGKHVYRRSSIAEVDGAIVRDTNNESTILSWESKKVMFEVSSGPYQNLYVDVVNDSGSIDFTGVSAAHREMMACLDR